jgi:ABC-type phosphate/phosphonate transport system substrate-binding protein
MGKPETSVVWPTVSQAVSYTQRNALIEATAVANGSNDSTHAFFYPLDFLSGAGAKLRSTG